MLEIVESQNRDVTEAEELKLCVGTFLLMCLHFHVWRYLKLKQKVILQVVCEHGPYYDPTRWRISITKEDLPQLASINKHAFDNIKDGAKVETFYFADNPGLTSVTADAR